jgi:SAM-dependent methyltransferase
MPSTLHQDALAAPQSYWTAGDVVEIARSLAPGAAEFVARLALCPGESVLDLACGTGHAAIPAARAGAHVTGIDRAPDLIAAARREACDAGCVIDFEIGDAESLPYAGGGFDTTVTMFGAMLAGRPERVASELLRVTRPGGRVAMANWTPGGFIGRLLRVHAARVPAPLGVMSPLAWGDPDVVRGLLGDRVATLVSTRRILALRFPFPPASVAELFAACYGPTIAALRAADACAARALRKELTRLFNRHNLARDGTTAVAGEYLDVRARLA